MPIFSKPNAIVYVRRSGLIVAGKKLTPARLNFEPEHIQNLELQDEVGFTDSLRDFFLAHSLKGKHVLMVLDDSIVFTKANVLDTETDAKVQPAAIADAFIAQMPLNPGQRACLRVLDGTNLKLYATNGDLYIAIADALDQARTAKIIAITPAAAYPTENGKQPLAAAVQQYVNDSAVRASANFQNSPLM